MISATTYPLLDHVAGRKETILSRAKCVQHEKIYCPTSKSYIKGFRGEPHGVSEYVGELEPVIDVADCSTMEQSQAWLTVNRYNAIVLNSRNMMIADVDFGDRRLNKFACADNIDEVISTLRDLHLLDDFFGDFGRLPSFAEQSYRVYRTHSGCRVICTSREFPRDSSTEYAADRLMQFLNADPHYVALCKVQACYRARLTPKPWRSHGEPHHVCNLVEVVGPDIVHENLAEQLAVHDEMCLPDSSSHCESWGLA